MNRYKVIFFGTPQFAVPALEALIKDKRFEIVAVITEPDKKAGRGKKIVFSPIKSFLEDHNMRSLRPEFVERARNDDQKQIKILQPTRIENCKLKIENLQPDVAVVCAYGQIIPKKILDIPKYGFVNIHPSLLPKYRGPSPIQTAILNGDKETGVSIMRVDEKMDHGDIISDCRLQIADLNYQELSEKLAKLGAELLMKVLPDYLEGKIKFKPQDHKKATYTKLLKKEDGLIDWEKSPLEIERQIRAYHPWPGTYTVLHRCTNNTNHTDCKRLKISKAHLKDNNLILDQVQLEGKKILNWCDFQKGYRRKIFFLDKLV